MWRRRGSQAAPELQVGEWVNGVRTVGFDPRNHTPAGRAQFVEDVAKIGIHAALQKWKN